jgi:hypothetical protein
MILSQHLKSEVAKQEYGHGDITMYGRKPNRACATGPAIAHGDSDRKRGR